MRHLRCELSPAHPAGEIHTWMANDEAAVWVAEIERHLVGMMAVELDQPVREDRHRHFHPIALPIPWDRNRCVMPDEPSW